MNLHAKLNLIVIKFFNSICDELKNNNKMNPAQYYLCGIDDMNGSERYL